jgi:hypothetical protein
MKQALEKRKCERVDVRFPIKFRDVRASVAASLGAQGKDISLGGLRFQTESFIPRNANLVLEFFLPESEKTIRAVSKVTWLKVLPSGYRFEVGSEFTEIDPSEMKLLRARLAHSPSFNN